MRILVFAFTGTAAARSLELLQSSVDKKYIASTEKAIDDLIEFIEVEDYDFIIGCGMYSGHDQASIRIETQCSSQFRNNKVNLQSLSIPYFFKEINGFKLTSKIGNSWCNLVSYQLLKISPAQKYTFLHISKSLDAKRVASLVDQQLLLLVH